MRKVILYIACSLDGFIAKPGEDLSFLDIVAKAGEDYGYSEFTNTVDTVIMGRRTYEWVMAQVQEFPHADKESFIITREMRESIGNVHFYSDDLESLVNRLKQKEGKNIFVDGGAEVVRMMMERHLLDEIILSIIPVILSDGIRLFSSEIPEQQLELQSAKSFETGLVQLHYHLKKN